MHRPRSLQELTLIRHGWTEAARAKTFPRDEPLDRAGRAAAARRRASLPAADLVLCSPALRARQTAAALGLRPQVQRALDECDFGSWSGRRLSDIHREDPDAVAAWMTDPAARPHGGESILELIDRVDAWLAGVGARLTGLGARGPSVRGASALAVTHSGVIRAAVVIARGAGPDAIWQIEVPPLSATTLARHDGGWTVESTAAAAPRDPPQGP